MSEAANVGVVPGAHLRVSGASGVAKGLDWRESLPAHPGGESCGEGRASGELRSEIQSWGYQRSCPPLHSPCGVASVPVRDFLLLILIVLPVNSLELSTSFFWDSEHENSRAPPGGVGDAY